MLDIQLNGEPHRFDGRSVHELAESLGVADQMVALAVNRLLAESEHLDVVVHNAGHMMFGPAEAFTPEQFAQQYDVNVLGTQRVNRVVLPHMRGRRQGLLLWVSSSSSAGGTPPYLSPYFAANGTCALTTARRRNCAIR